MMKSVTSLAKRLRVSVALLTVLATLPLGSALQSAHAKPPGHARAYGYRAKNKKQKRVVRRDHRQDRRETRRDRRDDRRDDRNYTTRYRTRTNSDGERVREYFRSYLN